MVTHHVSDKVKGGEGLSVHLAVKPDIFLEILRTLLQVRVFLLLLCLNPFWKCPNELQLVCSPKAGCSSKGVGWLHVGCWARGGVRGFRWYLLGLTF